MMAEKKSVEKRTIFNKEGVLDALYNEYGMNIALAERTSHDTRINYRNKAEGLLQAIRIVEGFEDNAPDGKLEGE